MKYFFLAILFLIVFAPTAAQAVWFDASWDYRIKIEVNPTKVGTTTAVTSFPVYLDLADLPADFWTAALADGGDGADLRMVESDETTETPFEIVSFDADFSLGELHFLADALATTSTSTFYLYYGNLAATAYASTSAYGAQNVWAQYVSVYHLEESSGTRFDSDASTLNFASSTIDASTTSKIYTGGDWEHANKDQISQADNAVYDFAGGDLSATVWLKNESTPASGVVKGLFAKDDFDVVTGRSWSTDLYNNAGTQLVRMFISGNKSGSQYDEYTWTRTLATSTFYHLAFTYDISNTRATRGVLFENAVSLGSGSVVNAGVSFSTIYNSTSLLRVGNYSHSAFTQYYDGLLDELRFSTNVFDRSWLQTEYNNQNAPDSFYWIGAQETDTPAGTTDPAHTHLKNSALYAEDSALYIKN